MQLIARAAACVVADAQVVRDGLVRWRQLDREQLSLCDAAHLSKDVFADEDDLHFLLRIGAIPPVPDQNIGEAELGAGLARIEEERDKLRMELAEPLARLYHDAKTRKVPTADLVLFLTEFPTNELIERELVARVEAVVSVLLTEVMSEAAMTAAEPVVLGGPDEPPIVFGKAKNVLTKKQYAVVKALGDNRPAGVTEERLQIESCCGDARGILSRLRKSDTDWGMAIHLPGPGRSRYRICAGAECPH